MKDRKPTSQTLISREFMASTHTEYDKLLKSMRDNGPEVTHNFYKCWSDKDKKAEEYQKEHKHEAFTNPARNVIDEQK